MNIIWTLMILFVGGGMAQLAYVTNHPRQHWPRVVALIAVLLAALPMLPLLASVGQVSGVPSELNSGYWLSVMDVAWIPTLGIRIVFGLDGLSLVLVLLTLFLGVVAVLSAWHETQQRQGFFFLNLLWTLAGVIGVFSALDLMLFFFFWEIMLVPMFFIISIWGHENRQYAAMKFFIYTQASSLLLLISILVLALLSWRQTGQLTFGWLDLVAANVGSQTSIWVMLGFFVAFLVKLPGLPVHNWLPDAHTQAPTAGSVILAGILLKTGAYGLLRFVPSLFPEALTQLSNIGMLLAVASILYGAKLAFAQTDLKRLIAYSSISHMGFVLLALFTWSPIALQGATIQMVAHGLSSAGLFALAGALQHRLHTRDLNSMAGLWGKAPRIGFFALFFILAALGLPGLGNFIGEFLVLLGTYQVWPTAAMLAVLAMVLSPVYALLVIQKAFHGAAQKDLVIVDFDAREIFMMSLLVVGLVVLGLFPNSILVITEPTVDWMMSWAP